MTTTPRAHRFPRRFPRLAAGFVTGLIAGLVTDLSSAPAHAQSAAAPSLARVADAADVADATIAAIVVGDGRRTTPDDLILTLRLDPGETLRAIGLDDDDTQNKLIERFVRSAAPDGKTTLRLDPPIDFDRLIGSTTTLRLYIDGPRGPRERRLPLIVAPVDTLSETLTLRQIVPEGAPSYTPTLPLRQAGNARLLALVDPDGPWAHRLTETGDALYASGEQSLALTGEDAGLSLAIVRELRPSGARLIQPVSLHPLLLSAFAADLDLVPDDGAPPRFTVPGAWNLDSELLSFPDRFLIERQDNGDLRLTARSREALAELGYPAAPLQLTVERRFAGQRVLQTLRLAAPTHSDAPAPAQQPVVGDTPQTDTPQANPRGSYRILPADPVSFQASPASPPAASPATPPVAATPPTPLAPPAAGQPAATKAARIPSGDITQYQYDALGNRTRLIDPLERSTSTAWDARNRPRTLTQPAPETAGSAPVTRLTWDARDQLTAVTDARGLTTAYAVDGLGRTSRLTSPDTGLAQSAHDAAGNLTSHTDARGQAQTRHYDAANRLVAIVHSGASGLELARVDLSYDQGTNGKGRLTGIDERDAAGKLLSSVAYTYDAQGRLASETRTLPASDARPPGSPPTVATQRTTWQAGGRPASRTLPSGRVIAYTWNDGQLSGLSVSASATASANNTPGAAPRTLVSAVGYHPFGGLKRYTLGNGRTIERRIDSRGRLRDYTLGEATRTLGYDAADRIVAIDDSRDARRNAVYTYDLLDRLTGSAQDGRSQAYRFDPTGNRLERSRTPALGSPATETTTVDPSSNRLLSLAPAGGAMRSFRYDAAGNLVDDGLRQYRYDARGRLNEALLGNASSRYQLDAFGRRVRKDVGSAREIHFHYDTAGHLVAETAADGTPLREFVYLHDTPVAVLVGGGL